MKKKFEGGCICRWNFSLLSLKQIKNSNRQNDNFTSKWIHVTINTNWRNGLTFHLFYLIIPKGSRILPCSMWYASLPFVWSSLINWWIIFAQFTILFLFSLFIFFYRSSCRRDHSTGLILKFGIEDFTDPGLPKIRSLTGLSFCLHKCFLYNLC